MDKQGYGMVFSMERYILSLKIEFISECSPGKYGENCSSTCKICPDGDTCHHVNGSCLLRLFSNESKLSYFVSMSMFFNSFNSDIMEFVI